MTRWSFAGMILCVACAFAVLHVRLVALAVGGRGKHALWPSVVVLAVALLVL